jgi:hypothetical protein
MAYRRIRVTTNSEDSQSLKTGTSNTVVKIKDECVQLLYRLGRKPPVYKAHVWARLDPNDWAGIHVLGGILKNDKEIIHGANCTFKVYSLNPAVNWAETLITTKVGTQQSNGNFTADFTDVELAPLELDGDPTIAVEIEVQRFKKVYKIKRYVNHLGIYDSLFRLKQEVDFLSITKKDE